HHQIKTKKTSVVAALSQLFPSKIEIFLLSIRISTLKSFLGFSLCPKNFPIQISSVSPFIPKKDQSAESERDLYKLRIFKSRVSANSSSFSEILDKC
ncbi:unnamed protein product, partial [Arabidopsis halleri]